MGQVIDQNITLADASVLVQKRKGGRPTNASRGRPRAGSAAARSRPARQVTLSGDLWATVDNAAVKQGLPRSRLVEAALCAYLACDEHGSAECFIRGLVHE